MRISSREAVSAVRSASVHAFTTLRLNLVLVHGISPAFRSGVIVHIFIPPSSMESVPSLSGDAIAYRWRSLQGVHRLGPVVLKAVPVMGAAFSGFTMDQLLCASLFPESIGGKIQNNIIDLCLASSGVFSYALLYMHDKRCKSAG